MEAWTVRQKQLTGSDRTLSDPFLIAARANDRRGGARDYEDHHPHDLGAHDHQFSHPDDQGMLQKQHDSIVRIGNGAWPCYVHVTMLTHLIDCVQDLRRIRKGKYWARETLGTNVRVPV